MSDPPVLPADAPEPDSSPAKRPWTILGRLAKAVREQNWFAVALELVIVVLGVVIGFQVTAWGEERANERAAAQLMSELRRDIEQTREEIESLTASSKRREARLRAMLTGLDTGTTGPERDSLLLMIGDVFVVPSWTPVFDTYTEALGSGRLNLIRDSELRTALSSYHSQNGEIEWVREYMEKQYADQQEPFMVANTVYAEVAPEWWGREDLLQTTRYQTDFDALAESRELWNLLTLRLESALMLQRRLKKMDRRAVRTLALLPES